MAKETEQQTMEEYLLAQLDTPVVLKDFVAIFHPELVEPDYKPKYYKLLR